MQGDDKGRLVSVRVCGWLADTALPAFCLSLACLSVWWCVSV